MKKLFTLIIGLAAGLQLNAADLESSVTFTETGGSTGAIDLIVNGGVAPYVFSWTGPDGYSASTEDISGLEYGMYTVTVTDKYCGIAVLEVFVDSSSSSSISEFSEINEIEIYPNPTSNIIYVQSQSKVDIEVYSLAGELVLRKDNTQSIDISEQESGSYPIKLIHPEGIISRQIIKL